MAFDGSIIACIVEELNRNILDGRIVKIAQPEKDELLLTIKKEGNQFRLLMDASPSLPIIYLTEYNQTAPLQAPAFCMLLRKHLLNGRIVRISQPSLERIIDIEIEHFNEMGDLCCKILTVELMGKHSNIIFREGTKILDSIKHVSALVSSVREVFPGKEYFIPFGNDKKDPLCVVVKKLNKVFKEVLYLEKDVDGNAHWINDLHSDSMTYITLINEIEKEFTVKIPIEKYGQLTTLNEFAKQLLDSGCK